MSRERVDPEESADVVILGGGPAGSATALTLTRAGLSVTLLLRPGTGPRYRGETLPPEIRQPLTELGIWERFEADGHVPSPGIVSVWGGSKPNQSDSLLSPFGPGWHVDRNRFDAMLLQAAADAGVVVRRDVLIIQLVEKSSEIWDLEGFSGERAARFQAKFLIDATGRAASPARRLAGHRDVYDRLVGVVGVVDAIGSTNHLDRRALVEAAEDGWWYSAPFPGEQRLVVAFMTDADLLGRSQQRLVQGWSDRLRHTDYTAGRVAADSRMDGLRIVTANTSRATHIAGRNWLTVGDGAASLDPLCGQGVYRALEAGLRAARATIAVLHNSHGTPLEYARLVEEEFINYLHKRSEHYSSERRWSRSPFWHRRHNSF